MKELTLLTLLLLLAVIFFGCNQTQDLSQSCTTEKVVWIDDEAYACTEI